MENERKRIYPERLTERTLDGVAELEKLCFSQPWSKNSLELLTREGIGVGMVCSSDGKICAYGGMIVAVDEGQITNIATHPDYRRRGLATLALGQITRHMLGTMPRLVVRADEGDEIAACLCRRVGYLPARRQGHPRLLILR